MSGVYEYQKQGGRPAYLGIEGAFKLQHVGILFWIDVFVREIHEQSINVDPEITKNVLIVKNRSQFIPLL